MSSHEEPAAPAVEQRAKAPSSAIRRRVQAASGADQPGTRLGDQRAAAPQRSVEDWALQRKLADAVLARGARNSPDARYDAVSTIEYSRASAARTRPVPSIAGRAVVQRTLKIGSEVYDKREDVDAIVKAWHSHLGAAIDSDIVANGDLDLAADAFDQDKAYKSEASFKQLIKNDRPSLVFRKSYWKRRLAASHGAPSFASTQGNAFWGSYGAGGNGRTLPEVFVIGRALLDDLAKPKAKALGRLPVYRSMPLAEAADVMAWYTNNKQATETALLAQNDAALSAALNAPAGPGTAAIMPIRNHLAGLVQAQGYGAASKLLKITLKPGAHEIMFSPQYAAVVHSGKTSAVMAATIKHEFGAPLPKAAGGEGILPGHIGIKSEGDDLFSFSLGDSNPSKLLFQLMVDEVREVKAD